MRCGAGGTSSRLPGSGASSAGSPAPRTAGAVNAGVFFNRKLAERFRVAMQKKKGHPKKDPPRGGEKKKKKKKKTPGFSAPPSKNAFYLRGLVRFVCGHVWLDNRPAIQCLCKKTSRWAAGLRSGCATRASEPCVRGVGRKSARLRSALRAGGSIYFMVAAPVLVFLGPPHEAQVGSSLADLRHWCYKSAVV